jgi:dihydropyrimidinase
VLRRGEAIVRDGRLQAAAGSGRFLPRSGGDAAAPRGSLTADMDPGRNFGAEIL